MIPQKVFEIYEKHSQDMLSLSGFGTLCQLVFMSNIEVVSSVSPLKQKKTLNLQGTVGEHRRGESGYKSVEVTEDITLRVYTSEKDFKRVSNVAVPAGSIMTIGNLSDMKSVNKAIAIIFESNRFVKSGEPMIHGLNNNYFMCFWSRNG